VKASNAAALLEKWLFFKSQRSNFLQNFRDSNRGLMINNLFKFIPFFQGGRVREEEFRLFHTEPWGSTQILRDNFKEIAHIR
jgi:hypothetical protein